MTQIACCHWLPERARWSYLARSGLPAVSRKQSITKSHIINPLFTKFARSRWLDIGLVLFFCEFIGPQLRLAKKERGQYPAILTSHLVNNPYIYICKILWSLVYFESTHFLHFSHWSNIAGTMSKYIAQYN